MSAYRQCTRKSTCANARLAGCYEKSDTYGGNGYEDWVELCPDRLQYVLVGDFHIWVKERLKNLVRDICMPGERKEL